MKILKNCFNFFELPRRGKMFIKVSTQASLVPFYMPKQSEGNAGQNSSGLFCPYRTGELFSLVFYKYLIPMGSEMTVKIKSKQFLLAILFVTLFYFSSFAQLITRQDRLQDMERMLLVQKKLASAREAELFGVYQQAISADEKQALDFLYAYMPLSDLADYSGDFYLRNARYSLMARTEMPWGKTVPEDEFLHFVLPVRVNNENLDSFRMVVYDELKNRVQGMSMHDAALEVNHWCHEKVTYKGSDARTSSPLSTMRYSFGRCGEESVFTVAALRTVGIPARQVYTPRWAHSDDNHAWVEVWVDGKWYFMGACEPDAELNMGWFAFPASRAMLVHTRVYGKYFGAEEVIDTQDRFSELNLISIYAPTKKIVVKVLRVDGKPATKANVEFRLYNYAEFFPIARTTTDEKGLSAMTLGMGDLLIFANDGNNYGFKPVTVSKTDTVEIKLASSDFKFQQFRFNQVPPAGIPVESYSGEKQKLNAQRLKVEDSLRTQYMNTFMSENQIKRFAQVSKYPFENVLNVLHNAQGNHAEISAFLSMTTDSLKTRAIDLLSVISEKDLRDATAQTLSDHLTAEMSGIKDTSIYKQYVLNPRISYEILSPWRAFLKESFGPAFIKEVIAKPEVVTDWIKANITIDLNANTHSRTPLTPAGVYKLKVADKKSRDIFFVAVCRAAGVPARLNPETQLPQYFKNDVWNTVWFESENTIPDKSRAELSFTNPAKADNLKSTINFTLSYLSKGSFRLYELPEEKLLNEFAAKSEELFPGNYLLVTGNRMSDGMVLSDLTFFKAEAGAHIELPVSIRKAEEQNDLYAKPVLNSIIVHEYGNAAEIYLQKSFAKNGMLLVFIDPDKEPSKHVIQDLSVVKTELEKWGGNLYFVMSPENISSSFLPGKYQSLPAQRKFVTDNKHLLISEISRVASRNLASDLPVVCLISKEGKILFLSSGYRIGTGNEILQNLSK